MLSFLLFFLLLLCGAFASAVFFKKELSESLPPVLFFIIIVLFLFAVCGALTAGVISICVLLPAGAAAALFFGVRKKSLSEALSLVVSPGLLLLIIAASFILVSNYGRVADSWDDFSHWADTVKRMMTLQRLPLASDGTQFSSYPPAMALIQYFVQWLGSAAPVFSEWKLYAVYQLACSILAVSLFGGISPKSGWFRRIAALLAVFALPHALFYHPLGILSIDAFLGMLAGYAVFRYVGKESLFEAVSAFGAFFVLVITKESGLLFSILAIATLAGYVLLSRSFRGRRLRGLYTVGFSLLGAVSAKLAWNAFLTARAGGVSSGAGSVLGGLSAAVSNPDRAFLSVIKNYVQELFSFTQRVGLMKMSFFSLFCLMLVSAALICIVRRSSGKEESVFPVFRPLLILAAYIVCLLFLYVGWSETSPYEAETLASFDRYLNTGFLAALFCLVGFAAAPVFEPASAPDVPRKKTAVSLLILFCLFLLLPLPDLSESVSRKTVRSSLETRAPYSAALAKANALGIPAGSSVMIVAQDTAGREYQTLRYVLQPDYTLDTYSWSYRLPGDVNNLWTDYKTPEQLSKAYLENCDYVLLYILDDYFTDHYAACFEAGAVPPAGSWCRVDPDTGLLSVLG